MSESHIGNPHLIMLQREGLITIQGLNNINLTNKGLNLIKTENRGVDILKISDVRKDELETYIKLNPGCTVKQIRTDQHIRQAEEGLATTHNYLNELAKLDIISIEKDGKRNIYFHKTHIKTQIDKLETTPKPEEKVQVQQELKQLKENREEVKEMFGSVKVHEVNTTAQGHPQIQEILSNIILKYHADLRGWNYKTKSKSSNSGFAHYSFKSVNPCIECYTNLPTSIKEDTVLNVLEKRQEYVIRIKISE